MVKDGIYYGAGFLLAALAIAFVLNAWWSLPLFVLSAFCFYFFRDPERTAPSGPVAVSPADGVVSLIRNYEDGGFRVSVFLNIFNVHVNRSPIAGRIESIEYQQGSFEMAHRETASENNEQNTFVIRPTDGGGSLEVKQIAGLIARRIVCYKKVGDSVAKGERIGLIKFGSRMDVRFGPEWRLEVAKGDPVAAGETVLAKRREANHAS
ncbi:MAG: phosphatidylserine decarboxylase [Acidobacteria bacterium]|nr:phosphatidylserine decarboxylase [Acidobacteriota bacterium]